MSGRASLVLLLALAGCPTMPQDPAELYWDCLNRRFSYVKCDEEIRQKARAPGGGDVGQGPRPVAGQHEARGR